MWQSVQNQTLQHKMNGGSCLHTDMADCQMVPRDYKEPCDSLARGEDKMACSTDYSRVRLKSGATLYFATNHRYLYEGAEGMKQAMEHIGTSIKELDVIVLGNFNAWSWASGSIFPDGFKPRG